MFELKGVCPPCSCSEKPLSVRKNPVFGETRHQSRKKTHRFGETSLSPENPRVRRNKHQSSQTPRRFGETNPTCLKKAPRRFREPTNNKQKKVRPNKTDRTSHHSSNQKLKDQFFPAEKFPIPLTEQNFLPHNHPKGYQNYGNQSQQYKAPLLP